MTQLRNNSFGWNNLLVLIKKSLNLLAGLHEYFTILKLSPYKLGVWCIKSILCISSENNSVLIHPLILILCFPFLNKDNNELDEEKDDLDSAEN